MFSEYDIVLPDVFALCDKSKIAEMHIKGAPDLLVEVLSPSTSLKDLREKKNLYEEFGVPTRSHRCRDTVPVSLTCELP